MAERANMLALEEVRKRVHPNQSRTPAPEPGGLKVLEVKVDEYSDSSGEDALEVFVVVPDKTSDEQLRWDNVEPIDQWIRERLREAGETRFAYISFGTGSDYDQRYSYDPDSEE